MTTAVMAKVSAAAIARTLSVPETEVRGLVGSGKIKARRVGPDAFEVDYEALLLQSERGVPSVAAYEKKLFFGNLPMSMTEKQLSELLSTVAGITRAHVEKGRRGASAKPFAFVTMSNGDAKRAIDSLNGYILQGRKLRVDVAQPKVRTR